MKPKLLLIIAWSLAAAIASPSLADEIKAGPIEALFASAGCGTLQIGTPEPLFLTGCLVQVECADSSVVSCSGSTTCSTGGTNNRCVVCDGVQQGCCPATCCEVCAANRDTCFNNCSAKLCGCNMGYNNCVASCTGGCS